MRHVVTAAVFRVRRAAELCSWAGVALGALAVSRDRPGAGRSVVASWRFVLGGVMHVRLPATSRGPALPWCACWPCSMSWRRSAWRAGRRQRIDQRRLHYEKSRSVIFQLSTCGLILHVCCQLFGPFLKVLLALFCKFDFIANFCTQRHCVHGN